MRAPSRYIEGGAGLLGSALVLTLVSYAWLLPLLEGRRVPPIEPFGTMLVYALPFYIGARRAVARLSLGRSVGFWGLVPEPRRARALLAAAQFLLVAAVASALIHAIRPLFAGDLETSAAQPLFLWLHVLVVASFPLLMFTISLLALVPKRAEAR